MIKKKNFLIIGIILIFMLMFLTTNSFAVNNYAYSVSTLVNGDTSTAALWANSYYMGAGYEVYRYNDPSSSLFTSMLNVNPRILFLAGHGNSQGVYFENSALITGSTNYLQDGVLYCGAQRYSWSNSLLVMLMGCKTAEGTSNITTQVAALVPQNSVVMGWRDLVADVDINSWSKRFNQYLRQGYNIRQATSYANSFSDYSLTSIKDFSVHGSQLTTITTASSSSVAEERLSISNLDEVEINIPYNINYEVNYNDESDMVNINNMLSKEFEDYNFNNYELEIINGQTDDDKIINLNLKIGDFVTSNGYVIFVENNKVTDIYNNHTYSNVELNNIIENQNLKTVKLNDYTVDINQCKEKSAKKLLRTIDGSINTNQEVKLYYDIEEGKKYITVITQNEKNGIISCFADKYEM